MWFVLSSSFRKSSSVCAKKFRKCLITLIIPVENDGIYMLQTKRKNDYLISENTHFSPVIEQFKDDI